MAHLLAVAALNIVHVGRLVAVSGEMAFLAAISASTTTALGTILRKVTGYGRLALLNSLVLDCDLLSSHLRQVTLSRFGSSSQSEARWPDLLSLRQYHTVNL